MLYIKVYPALFLLICVHSIIKCTVTIQNWGTFLRHIYIFVYSYTIIYSCTKCVMCIDEWYWYDSTWTPYSILSRTPVDILTKLLNGYPYGMHPETRGTHWEVPTISSWELLWVSSGMLRATKEFFSEYEKYLCKILMLNS